MSETSVRGPGKARGGATDTTMLIWKVIAANPGITRAGIWERVEHAIPEGYACRRYATELRKRGIPSPDSSPLGILKARKHLLTYCLGQMRRYETITCTGDGDERRYAATRPPGYSGDPGAIDETGTKAAEHMAVADALRTAEKWLARAKPDRVDSLGRRSVPVLGPPSRKEYEALTLVVKALRAKGSSEG